jgi:hypothetical protein
LHLAPESTAPDIERLLACVRVALLSGQPLQNLSGVDTKVTVLLPAEACASRLMRANRRDTAEAPINTGFVAEFQGAASLAKEHEVHELGAGHTHKFHLNMLDMNNVMSFDM